MNGTSSRQASARPPVSAHPAFPAIVALWFTALLGIGTLVLPVALIERLSVASGLSSIVAEAQPPLGITARIMIALAAAVTGTVLGLIIAGRVARAATAKPAKRRTPDARTDEGNARVFSARDELAEDALDAPAPARETLAGRRRPLSVTDDSARSEFFDTVPLPGAETQESATPMATEAASIEVDFELETPQGEPLDLTDFHDFSIESDDVDAPEPESDCEIGPAPAFVRGGPPEPSEPFGTAALSSTGAQETRSFAVPEPQPEPVPSALAEPHEETAMPEVPSFQSTAHDVPGQVAIVDLVDRFARALERHREDARAQAGSAEARIEDEREAVIDFTSALSGRTTQSSEGTQADEPEVAESMPAPAPFAPALEAAPVAIVPEALRPLSFDDLPGDGDTDETSELLGLSLTLSQTSRAFSRPENFAPSATPQASVTFGSGMANIPALPDEDEDEEDEGYPSLLAMKSPFGLPRESIRIDDELPDDEAVIEPVVVFPGQAARRPSIDATAEITGRSHATGPRPFDAPSTRAEGAAVAIPAPASARPPSGETERALREALEKLQRMSGAA